MTLLARCRAIATRPLLDRLRFYDQLEELSLDEVAAFVASVDAMEDSAWLGEVLARIVSGRYWLAQDRDDDPVASLLEDITVWRRGARWVAELVAALDDQPERALPRLYHHAIHSGGLAQLTEHLPRIAALASHSHAGVRAQAAFVSVAARHVTPAVSTAVGELLDGLAAEDAVGYDEQVFGEELLAHIAAMGPALASLAPKLVPILASASPAFRAGAAEAAGAMADPALVASVKELAGSYGNVEARAARSDARDAPAEFAIRVVRAQARLALWRLTGDVAQLDGALADAGTSVVFTSRISHALENAAPSEPLFAGAVRMAQLPDWYVAACDVLAEHGPAAAQAMQAIAPPARAESAYAYHNARWKTGLVDDAGLVNALQPLLAGSWQAWRPYVAANLGTPAWISTIRAEIIAASTSAVLDALTLSPDIALRFVRELLVAGREEVVETVWRARRRELWDALE